MPPEELKNMHSHFKNHANVLLISYEQSLNSFKSLDFYLKCDHFGLNEIDDIRFSICKEFYKFLDIVQQEAKTIKPLVSARIMELGKRSIIYSDIDNTFFRKPLFQLSPLGIRGFVCVDHDFILNSQLSLNQTKELFEERFEERLRQAEKHQSFFITEKVKPLINLPLKNDFSREILLNKSDALYEYFKTGAAFNVYKTLRPNGDTRRLFRLETRAYLTLIKSAQSEESPTSSESCLFWSNNIDAKLSQLDTDNRIGKLLYLQQLKHFNVGGDGSYKPLYAYGLTDCLKSL